MDSESQTALIPSQVETPLQSSLSEEDCEPLPDGASLCAGHYRLLQLLHRRPRVHLYLAQRLTGTPLADASTQSLVAIREIILTGLAPELRLQIEQAAFEEFAAPRLFGSPHLCGVADRVHIENGRHYLIMQPRAARGRNPGAAVLLSELLPAQAPRAAWPDMPTALNWAIQLCYTVAHLNRMKNILGEITPAMVLVDRDGRANWAPLLLASWPPAPPFWDGASQQEARAQYRHTFPLSTQDTAPAEAGTHTSAAPEIFAESYDERADVYALGAFLYLLFTGSEPRVAAQPPRGEPVHKNARGQRHTPRLARKTSSRHTPAATRDLALTPPQLLNGHISPLLAQILLRALSSLPEERFANALHLAQALEGIRFKTEIPTPAELPRAKASRLKRLLEWLKKQPRSFLPGE